MSAPATIPDIRSWFLETRRSRLAGYGAWVYWLDGCLVDCGFPRACDQLLAGLADLPVSQVVLTHYHEDHVGNAAALAKRGARVLASTETIPRLADPSGTHYFWYERTIWGVPPAHRADALGDQVRTPHGQLDVIPTPGHSADHIAFFEPERRWLFTGDLFLGVRIGLARPEENSADLVASLRRVLSLKPRMLFCTHRGPVEDAEALLRAKLDWLTRMREDALRLRDKGLAPTAIGRALLGPDPLAYRVFTQGDYSRRNFAEALLKPGLT